MKTTLIAGSLGFAATLFAAGPALAAVSAQEAARLGKDLTPIGAEKAGNKDGTIPEWTPGEQDGDLSGEYPHNDEIDGEKPTFTITKANMAKYADKLTEGHKELLGRYDDYKMNVYPSYRFVAFPDEIYEATQKNATTAELVAPDRPQGATLGFPFPIPKSGAEPIWNHKLKWRGEGVRRYNNQMIVRPNQPMQLTKLIEDVQFAYASMENPQELKDGTPYLYYLSETVAPPRLAGQYILVHDKTGTGNEGRSAWLYNPGFRRIRRAPAVCCDNPYEGTEGYQFYDQVDMFNGILDYYDWKLLGKKEMYIPYNDNKIAGDKVTYKEIATPNHINQDLPRYELHRVWVVEANNKPGLRHKIKKRVFYIDEDSWNIVAVDNYDQRDELWQFQEGHLTVAPNVQSAGTVPEVIYHFDSGVYFVTAAFNEDEPYDFEVNFSKNHFTASSVQKNSSK